MANFPSIANAINSEVVQIATFDIIDTEEWVDPLVYGEIPEKDPFSMSFERTGIESTLLIANISVILWLIILHAAVIVFVFLPIWLLNHTIGIFA